MSYDLPQLHNKSTPGQDQRSVGLSGVFDCYWGEEMTIQTPEQVRALIAQRDALLAALLRVVYYANGHWMGRFQEETGLTPEIGEILKGMEDSEEAKP